MTEPKFGGSGAQKSPGLAPQAFFGYVRFRIQDIAILCSPAFGVKPAKPRSSTNFTRRDL
ncbi:hypothetical protein DENIT_20206 [Pseudomonas veronii]|nr:hypothetical protein DENIT_20206 [Pseudomonas veronii]